jgi:hypothetical protein
MALRRPNGRLTGWQHRAPPRSSPLGSPARLAGRATEGVFSLMPMGVTRGMVSLRSVASDGRSACPCRKCAQLWGRCATVTAQYTAGQLGQSGGRCSGGRCCSLLTEGWTPHVPTHRIEGTTPGWFKPPPTQPIVTDRQTDRQTDRRLYMGSMCTRQPWGLHRCGLLPEDQGGYAHPPRESF